MNIITAIREEILVPIHPAGWPFIGAFAVVSAIITALWTPFWPFGLALTLWCVYFFRNPRRTIPQKPGWIIAPADGRVISVDEAEVPEELDLPEGSYRRIAIFMNVFDVHVNRMPASGAIHGTRYIPGAFLNASLDKASTDNERMALTIDLDADQGGKRIGVVQIAGLVARRILCDVQSGDRLQTGQVFGLIRFGSRVDVWLPADVPVMVLPGQKTIAGETVLADMTAYQHGPDGAVTR